MITEPELLNERLERLAMVLDEIMPNCASLVRYALALLKEQETEWEHLWDAPDRTFKGRCKNCGFVHFFIEGHDTQYKFCPECGRKVKWE